MQNEKQSILHFFFFFFSERVRWTSSEPALTHTCSPEHGAVPLQLAPRDTVDSGVECSETACQVETDTFVLHKHFQLSDWFFIFTWSKFQRGRTPTAAGQIWHCHISDWRVSPTNIWILGKKVCTEFQHEQILVCHTSQVVSALYTKHLSARISLLVAVKAKEVRRCVDSCWCSRSKRRLRRGGWRNGWTCGTSSQTWRTDWPWRGNGVPVNREE